ncbi:hypothetical protein AN1V17_34060 [Vallitalea sediminicola]
MERKVDIVTITNMIYPKDSKTNITHNVKIDNDFDSLTIEFCYSPKKLLDMEKAKIYVEEGLDIFVPQEYRDDYKNDYGRWEDYTPLLNLVTLSLDDESDEYRGCAHRHSNNQIHIISNEFASPGFIKGEIIKGIWKFVINVHAVVTEQCEYQIKVTGRCK